MLKDNNPFDISVTVVDDNLNMFEVFYSESCTTKISSSVLQRFNGPPVHLLPNTW